MDDIKIGEFDPNAHLAPENQNQGVSQKDFYEQFEIARKRREASGGKTPQSIQRSPEQTEILDPDFLKKLAEARANLNSETANGEKKDE